MLMLEAQVMVRDSGITLDGCPRLPRVSRSRGLHSPPEMSLHSLHLLGQTRWLRLQLNVLYCHLRTAQNEELKHRGICRKYRGSTNAEGDTKVGSTREYYNAIFLPAMEVQSEIAETLPLYGPIPHVFLSAICCVLATDSVHTR